MNEEEKREFTEDVLQQINQILANQSKSNEKRWDSFDRDLRIRLEETIPNVLKQLTPKQNYWFPVVNSMINGAAVGIAIYVAIILTV